MGKNVLIIGGHGMLGRPVTRRLLQDGFTVRIMARNPEKAAKAFTQKIDIVKGDLEKVESIDQAMQGMDAVFLTVDTPHKNLPFSAESNGAENVVAAAKNHKEIRLLLHSAYGQGKPDASPWWHVQEKKRAREVFEKSGCAWTIFDPSWFYESLPLFVQNKKFMAFTGIPLLPYWIGGDDYGRIISAALTKNIGIEKSVPVQGKEKLSVVDIGKQFVAAYDPSLQIATAPFFVLKIMGIFSEKMSEMVKLVEFCAKYPEAAPDESVYRDYAEPVMNVADYAAYCKKSGDFPVK